MGGGFWGDFANRQARHECSASPQLAAEIIADKSKRKVNLRVSLGCAYRALDPSEAKCKVKRPQPARTLQPPLQIQAKF